MSLLLFRIAAALCFLAVALGAFGAHSLKGVLEANGTLEAGRLLCFTTSRMGSRCSRWRCMAGRIGRVLLARVGRGSFQRESLPARADEYSLAGRDHAARRALFSGGLGVADLRAAALILLFESLSASRSRCYVPLRKHVRRFP